MNNFKLKELSLNLNKVKMEVYIKLHICDTDVLLTGIQLIANHHQDSSQLRLPGPHTFIQNIFVCDWEANCKESMFS